MPAPALHLLPAALALSGEDQAAKPDFFFMIVVILAIFWFVAFLPARKERKKKAEMLEAIKKNDRILTSFGAYATVAAIGEQDVTIKFDDGPTRVKVLKSTIASVLEKNGDEAKS